MFHSSASFRYILGLLFCGFLAAVTSPACLSEPIDTSESKIITDSLEPINRRIYSYDMRIDSNGDVHLVYSKPYSDLKANIYYVRRIGGVWQNALLLTPDGYRASSSTHIVIGDDDVVHVCYIYDNNAGGDLYYQKIVDGVVFPAVFVAGGGFHTRMQLDENGYPVFVRGAQPGGVWKLALLTTTDGATWDKAFLNLTQVPKFRLADFVYADGTYHITYGNTAYIKEVWNNKYMTERVDGVFHDLYYATSTDGVNWTEYLIDDSQTLYEMEFWTALELVDGRPLVAMYKYAEYGNVYNRGTSAKLSEWTGSNWKHKIITDQTYPDTSNGMGIGLAVNGTGDFFAAWDFSPDDTHDDDFRGPRGNIALSRSGPKGEWTNRVQLDPFSMEGRAKLRVHGGKLFFLALGDFVDTKLFFREYSISELNKVLPPPGGAVSPGSSDVPLSAIYHMLLHQSSPSPPSGLKIK